MFPQNPSSSPPLLRTAVFDLFTIICPTPTQYTVYFPGDNFPYFLGWQKAFLLALGFEAENMLRKKCVKNEIILLKGHILAFFIIFARQAFKAPLFATLALPSRPVMS